MTVWIIDPSENISVNLDLLTIFWKWAWREYKLYNMTCEATYTKSPFLKSVQVFGQHPTFEVNFRGEVIPQIIAHSPNKTAVMSSPLRSHSRPIFFWPVPFRVKQSPASTKRLQNGKAVAASLWSMTPSEPAFSRRLTTQESKTHLRQTPSATRAVKNM